MVEPSNPEETRRICISVAPTKKILMHTVPEGSLISSWHLQTILNLFAIKIYFNLAPYNAGSSTKAFGLIVALPTPLTNFFLLDRIRNCLIRLAMAS